jgi:hypothetical protein
MNQTCTITKDCGLSNRIKSILSALSLYDEVNTIVDADSYIFPSIKKVDTVINPYINWRLEVLPEEEHFIDEYKTIDFLYEKTPKYFIKKYLKYVNKLQINSDILEYVDDFVKDWDSDVMGVHIRTWHSDGPRMLWHDNSIFEAEIDKFPVNKKIFLCSDNPETIKYFCKKYSERIITHPQKLHDTFLGQINTYDQYQNDIQLIVDGFIDCLLLSKCNSIIGTWCSTFTEVAWWFGQCKSEVIIPRPINFDDETNKNVFLVK